MRYSRNPGVPARGSSAHHPRTGRRLRDRHNHRHTRELSGKGAVMGIVQAQPRDVGAIWNLRNERAQWLSTLGSDQWSQAGLDRDAFINRVHASIKAGETWVWLEDGAVLGTIALDQWADPGLWSAEEREVSLIVHRMMTTRAAAGRGIGTALLQHAEQV